VICGPTRYCWTTEAPSNLFRISSHGEAGNYRAYASPSFEVVSHIKELPFQPLLLYYYYSGAFSSQ